MTTATFSDHVLTLPIRVYYEDTDAEGVVYYANYLKFFERARTEYLRVLGVNQFQLTQEAQAIFVVVNVQLHYKKPARLDDLIQIQTFISGLSRTSCTFEQTAQFNGQTLVHASVKICCVHAHSFKPMAIPSSIHNLFAVQQKSSKD